MNSIEPILKGILFAHIAGGTAALITGLGAMFTTKGSPVHKKFGKAYFWSMTVVFAGAVILALGHHLDFLMMVAFFSYYMTVRGYRILKLKNLYGGQKPTWLDWMIVVLSAIFMLLLFIWGARALLGGSGMGIVAIVFGSIGSSFLIGDVRKFFQPPREKMHWYFGHIAGMGGSYISAVTAFIVVNIQIGQFNWILWILPALVGGIIIGRTIRHYKVKFAPVASRE